MSICALSLDRNLSLSEEDFSVFLSVHKPIEHWFGYSGNGGGRERYRSMVFE